ncbi:MAG: hypothetical protein IT204_18545 [Fimbriimonadaceae bacterium]|nr:hypothetical protein [Fimbriimonadaceae bacterium]
MDEMKELLDEQQVAQAIRLLGLLGPLVGLTGGLVWARLRGLKPRLGLLWGLFYGLLGSLVWGLWKLYSHLVRYEPAADPRQDYFGLERVDVLLLNVLIFATVGALVGRLARWLRERPSSEPAAEPTSGDAA